MLTLFLIYPELRRQLANHPELDALLIRLRQRLVPWNNLALVVLLVTGMLQMSADPNYSGLMQFENEWSRVILFKHLALIGLVIAGAILQFRVFPALDRVYWLRQRDKHDPAEWERLRAAETRWTGVSVALGVVILALSAWAVSL
ncbi:MAG: CopD family protein [Anaerolineae bacterium]|nr:CopD family protein [Anaerolineae bacterium]